MAEKVLEVFYKNEIVGTLKETPDKKIAFQYEQSWINNGFSVSPFSLPLRGDVFVPKSRVFDGLFGVFADSLPDSWGRLLLERFLEKRGVDRNHLNTLDRLAYVGSSGMGALEYRPAKNIDFTISGYTYDDLANACKAILESKPSEQLETLYELGGSSGGTRPKVLITENDKDWIVKLPYSDDPKDSGKMEFDYSVCAKNCGISMTETELVSSKVCQGYFKTARYDRGRDAIGNVKKIHCVTAAGLLEADFRAPVCDYRDLLKLTNILTREDKPQIEQMFRIMCFNVYGHNLDDHVKNFSFLYDEGKWKLAPAYDLTFSNTYYGEHTTSVAGKGKNISDEDLLKVGKEAGISKKACETIMQEIRSKVGQELKKYLK